MATRIREFDWANHPLGSQDYWPQSLRSALGIALNSAFPTAIYWGSDLRLLYNDAWSSIPGPRHPQCLGEPANSVWSDIWHVIEPQFSQVIETGEGLFVDDQLLPMRRHGFEEETYWSYSFTPIIGEDGAIEGIFNSGQETTDKVLKQRQTAFLLKATETIRSLAEPDEVMDVVCRMLGEHLEAIRVGIREMDPGTNTFPIAAEWADNGREPAGPDSKWTSLGAVSEGLRRGHVVRIERVSDFEDATAREYLSSLGAAAAVAVPWFRSGKLSAVLFVHRAEAGKWEDEEINTIEQAVAIAFHAVDEERAAAREKAMMLEIDHRARNLLTISQALVRLTEADNVETFKTSLLTRMSSLGKTLGILSASKWIGTSFSELLEEELTPFRSDDRNQVSLRGPKVLVSSYMAQPIAMAVHELTTNAVKYGALSNRDGTLDIVWDVGPDRILNVTWSEKRKGLNVATPPSARGFGSKLLTITIEGQLGGSVEREMSDGAFECRFNIPFPDDGNNYLPARTG